jgi:hypothetical protein
LGFKLGVGDLSEDVTSDALEDMEDDFGVSTMVVVDLLSLKDDINGSP